MKKLSAERRTGGVQIDFRELATVHIPRLVVCIACIWEVITLVSVRVQLYSGHKLPSK